MKHTDCDALATALGIARSRCEDETEEHGVNLAAQELADAIKYRNPVRFDRSRFLAQAGVLHEPKYN